MHELHHSKSLPIVARSTEQVSSGGADAAHDPVKRARLADNSSMGHPADAASCSNNKMEMEVDALRAELEETKRLLREKTVEVEKSTQLFTMFD